MAINVTLPPRPTSPPMDANGNWRQEWLRYFDALDKALRALIAAS